MRSRRHIERYGEDYERPKLIDTSDAMLLLPALLLLLGLVALVWFTNGS